MKRKIEACLKNCLMAREIKNNENGDKEVAPFVLTLQKKAKSQLNSIKNGILYKKRGAQLSHEDKEGICKCVCIFDELNNDNLKVYFKDYSEMLVKIGRVDFAYKMAESDIFHYYYSTNDSTKNAIFRYGQGRATENKNVAVELMKKEREFALKQSPLNCDRLHDEIINS